MAQNKQFNKNKFEIKINFLNLVTKGIFMHIDKITLIAMYLVSVSTVNFIHVILVFILIFQIIAPGRLNGCYKIITLIFQLLYLIEFIIDFLKIQLFDFFNRNKDLLQFFFVYNVKRDSNDIEFLIYGVILCFYFQYRTCNIYSIKKILKSKKVSVREYLTASLKNHKNWLSFLLFLGNHALHIYIWSLIFGFIFFNSFFEINLIFGIKLIFFLISCYNFIYLIQNISKNTHLSCFFLVNRILLFICCFNTLLVYLYQYLCKDFLKVKDKIKNNTTSFFIQNLPNIGFTIYEEEKNLYKNLLPHFITTFIAVLFILQSEETLQKMVKYLNLRKSTLGEQIQEEKLKKEKEKKRMERIKKEQNEFIQDKLYSDK